MTKLKNSNGEDIAGLFFLPIEYPFMDAWVFAINDPVNPPPPKPKGWGCKIAKWLMDVFDCNGGEK